ncbi:MAG: D-lactate dehydrogenase [Thermomicrobiales bacterium]
MIDRGAFLDELRQIVDARNVLVGSRATRSYVTGYRYGGGDVLAVVKPGSLVEQWRVIKLAVNAGVIIIMQAANTGLTGGSTPAPEGYDRPVLVINTMRMAGLHLINDGRQVICLPGTTLYSLELALRPIGREPHSVIGSSCIGASVLGGICNNSGGALVRRGPAYTELALYARVNSSGKLDLVNHLGIRLGDDPETVLARLERGEFTEADIVADTGLHASDHEYGKHIREIDAATPARFNADQRRLFEASGSAGHVAIFAVRLDTFLRDKETAVFYIGTNDPQTLGTIRRDLLGNFSELPIAAEYLHREAFDIAARYGKDMFLAIQRLGTDRIPKLMAVKTWADGIAAKFGLANLPDRIMQWSSRFFLQHLPARMLDFRDRYEHHLLLKMADDGIAEARSYFDQMRTRGSAGVFECTPEEAEKAFLHRFVAAGAAVRYRIVHRKRVEDIIALDIALPRSTADWFERLPQAMEEKLLAKLYYGHFLCHVFHQDYLVAKGANTASLEQELHDLLDARGAEYPAEHNVGHLYHAKPQLINFYKDLDPCNMLNPGIGKTSKNINWAA